ncbi:hypothetical protein O0L34_g4473 [Tuta absoluta]|nr:hypothetical protein O0L34_g4473 [Tuta absoluta]
MEKLAFIVLFISQMVCLLEAKPSSKLGLMPSNCKFFNYCHEKGDGYPQVIIDNAVNKSPIKAGDIVEINQREGSLGEEDEDAADQPCESTDPDNDPIYYIKDTNDDIRYVAQSDNFVQRIREVKCRNPGLMESPKMPFEMDDVLMYNVTCVEQLVPVKFMVLAHNGKTLEVATIKGGLPMACSCKYTYHDYP